MAHRSKDAELTLVKDAETTLVNVNVKNEVEVKLRVADVHAIRRLLRRLRASSSGRVHQMDTLYDTPRGHFRRRGHLLRLREVRRGPHGTGPAVAGVLTYKGPAMRLPAGQRGRKARPGPVLLALSAVEGRYKIRAEIEVAIPSAHLGGLRAILGAVGLVPSFRYEKFRTTYRLPAAGPVADPERSRRERSRRAARAPGLVVELDETPVGTFLELEGAPKAIDRTAKQLGYGPADYITKSYLGIHLESCRHRGVPQRDMLFRPRSAGPSPTRKK